ncbi:MAG: sigma-70 family RNA polymerase sigma factor [Oscillospiraceae bacterium]|nr:sigma-70 family RNA polymerase sigma factor [Oscillospiraceae bacterium]
MTRVSLDKIQDFIRDTSYDEDISNKKNITKIHKILKEIISNELSNKQKETIILYFYNQKNVTQISKLLDVHKSTVSRNLSRGIKNIEKFIKYNSLR